MTLAVTLLFGLLAATVTFGAHTSHRIETGQNAPMQGRAWTDAAFANADEPACAHALARARNTQGLSSEAAIAASTAMLRACHLVSSGRN